ncbi:hypothetical protein [Bacillus halotolerans]|uniref:hypothetical protein n=1 Tax=Bacillus halotolerans TaxID=260554 RepID=UPI002DCB1A74|nr:hypothetical protein [Bacillus halotolerans]MEC0357346.1 hypothetical protein [Bacillus halotolerans]
MDILSAEVVSPIEIKLNENDKLIIPANLIIVPKRLRAGEEEALNTGESVMVVSLKFNNSNPEKINNCKDLIYALE